MQTANLAKIFKALSNERRLELFQLIYTRFQKEESRALEGGASCCEGVERMFTEACQCLDLSRSTISHHFKELENAGLITTARRGQACVCQVNPEALSAIRSFMD